MVDNEVLSSSINAKRKGDRKGSVLDLKIKYKIIDKLMEKVKSKKPYKDFSYREAVEIALEFYIDNIDKFDYVPTTNSGLFTK